MTPFLLNDKALRARVDKLYDAMKQRAKPKVYKNGRKRGQVRVPGLTSLPFTKQQLWDHLFRLIGLGAILCPYCQDIGRNATPISLQNCVLDHKVPVCYAGAELTLTQTWNLSNICPCCEDCNRLKGKLTYPFFVGLLASIDRWPDERDRKYVYACLRTHGVILRSFGKKPLAASKEFEDVVTTGTLQLEEPW